MRVIRSFASTEMQSLEATVGEPTVKCRRDSTDCILKEGESFLDVRRIECCRTHQYVLEKAVSSASESRGTIQFTEWPFMYFVTE